MREEKKFYRGLVNQHVQYYSYCSAFLVISSSNGLTESNFVVTVSFFFFFFFFNEFGSVSNLYYLWFVT